ncbi:Protein C25F9.2 protein [Aphelenchoides avenae]|nr:Protein C25F9.2 protein [Aphelenchus avenae]
MILRGPSYRRPGPRGRGGSRQVQHVLSEYTDQLMQALNVPRGQDSYAVEEWGVGFPCSPQQGYVRICPHCNKTFYRHECYEEHIRNKTCEMYRVCLDCGACYNTRNVRRFSAGGEHVCNTRLCFRCKCFHAKEDSCFIAPLEPPEEKDTRFLAFDFESECVPTAANDQVAEHKVNQISAKIFCNRCLRDGTWTDNDYRHCEICGDQGRMYNFNGAYRENPLKDFVEFLKGMDKEYDTYAFSHYGGRYDMILLNGEYLRQGGYKLSFIRTGMKIYQMVVASKNGSPKTVFRDSYNLFPFALGQLVSAFSLYVQDKGIFPFHYNKAENYFVELPHLPEKHYYGYATMKPSKQAAFDAWYAGNYNTPFMLARDIQVYCENDVEILAHALAQFREEWMSITGDDCLRNAMTLDGSSGMRIRMACTSVMHITAAKCM